MKKTILNLITIDKLINAKGVTASQFLQDYGLSHTAMYNWKTKNLNPGLDAMVKIADYFEAPIDYLIGRNLEHKQTSQLSEEEELIINSYRKLGEFEQLFLIKNITVLSLLNSNQGGDE